MTQSFERNSTGPRSGVNLGAGIGLLLVVLFFLISGTIAYRNITILRDSDARIRHSHEVITGLDELLSTVQDAETGQRGYLLTGRNQYLAPYSEAVSRVGTKLDAIATLTRDNATQQARMDPLRRHVSAKLAELKQTIDLRQSGDSAGALALVNSDRGKAEMDAVRAQLDLMQEEEARLRQQRLTEMADAYQAARLTGLLAAAVGILLTLIIGELLRRATKTRERQQWLEAGQARLATVMLGEQSDEELGQNILAFLTRFLGAQGGALFAGDGGHFRRVATLGVPGDAKIPDNFSLKEGLLGQVAADREATMLSDIPENYLTIGSALGQDKPRHLTIAPAIADDTAQGVIELGFLQPVGPDVMAFLEQAAGAIGVALRSARFRTDLQNLLRETQRQSEELQVQSEELRVSNEELEEQGNALKEQQARLEQQQVELEQTNAQLEEQAQQLEVQRDDLSRSNAAVELKARELEQASRYKSDFLANMSHELRTPLNSLLILSKLLGDNPKGNLSEEQVKYATTIQSSGNDLLQLINDILDLSKIEAGHVQIRPETVAFERLTRDMRQVFMPIAGERGLDFDIRVAEDSPASIETDRQRLEQILKNLLSNAFKFTEQGSVTLEIAPAAAGQITLSVVDTGIGISEDQQREIFEAFRQADGTISRRYGGTGLGLSISRELARLLGGAIVLSSTPGKGSRFALTIPLAYDPALVAEREEPMAAPAPA
ncbi:MAG TPA: CHASE3 domain-containing protein, partial [Sphingomonas sp.]|nr:CHASE3 domain-containing protein [Sphingomonas sp.]